MLFLGRRISSLLFCDIFILGRIVNRFSKDLDIVDVNIPMTIRMWLGTGSGVFTTLFVISYSTPLFLIVIIPLGIMYYFVQVGTNLKFLFGRNYFYAPLPPKKKILGLGDDLPVFFWK